MESRHIWTDCSIRVDLPHHYLDCQDYSGAAIRLNANATDCLIRNFYDEALTVLVEMIGDVFV